MFVKRRFGAPRSRGLGLHLRHVGRAVAVAALVAAGVAVTIAATRPARPAAAAAYAASAHDGWQASWRAAPQPPRDDGPSSTGFADQTLRMVVRTTIGGRAARVRISNVYGTRPLQLGAVTIAEQSHGPATGDPYPVTFGGRGTATVAPGAEAVSDPLELATRAGEYLAVSLYLPVPTGPATWHARGLVTTYLARGDRTAVRDASRFPAMATASWFFLDGIDVLGRPARGGIVAFGDSITDGSTSTVNAYHSYPDWLADRLGGYAVLNAGIAGNRILTDTRVGGDSALHRFGRDALDQPGVTVVVLLEGINDITSGNASAEQLIVAMRELVARAHERCVAIVGATLTPLKGSGSYTAGREETRELVNRWIRTSGAFDGVADFAAAVHDSGDPEAFDPRNHLPRNLHPNDRGYRVMADTLVPTLLHTRLPCGS